MCHDGTQPALETAAFHHRMYSLDLSSEYCPIHTPLLATLFCPLFLEFEFVAILVELPDSLRRHSIDNAY